MPALPKQIGYKREGQARYGKRNRKNRIIKGEPWRLDAIRSELVHSVNNVPKFSFFYVCIVLLNCKTLACI